MPVAEAEVGGRVVRDWLWLNKLRPLRYIRVWVFLRVLLLSVYWVLLLQ